MYLIYLIPYIFYYRVYDYFWSRRFYEKQEGVAVIEGAVPLLGNLVTCLRALRRARETGDNSFMLKHLLDLSIEHY